MTLVDFSKDFALENERTLLRPLAESDVESLLTYSINEPKLWDYSLVPANNLEHLQTYIKLAIENRKNNTAYPFLVIDKRTNEVAGSTRFYDYQPGHNTVQIGYTWYGKRFQGTGLNKNCKYLMLSLAFEDWGVERVEFRADFRNKVSIAAMKSLGCTEEGILRSNCTSIDGRRDSIILSILKSEWFGSIKSSLELKIAM